MSGQFTVPGIRCECRLHSADGAVRVVAGVFDAPGPARAVRWIRVAVRTLVSTLDEESAEPVHEWLLFGERPAVQALSRGQVRSFCFGFEGWRVEFTAHPVRYLVLADHSGSPACPQMPALPPAVTAVPGRGFVLTRPASRHTALPPEPLPDEGVSRA